jgi:hypothetical protein
MAGRPKQRSKCSKHCISLSPESQEIIERGGYNSNLSAFIDGLIRHTAADSPAILAIRMERVGKETSALEEALMLKRAELITIQSQINLGKQRESADNKGQHDARTIILRKWESLASSRGNLERDFPGWLTGPATLCLIKDAGFQTPDEVVSWCKTESRRR